MNEKKVGKTLCSHLFDEPGKIERLHVCISGEAIGAGHQAQRKPVVPQEREHVVLLDIRPSCNVDDQVPQLLPAPGIQNRARVTCDWICDCICRGEKWRISCTDSRMCRSAMLCAT